MNRMTSQKSRGGSFFCILHENLTYAFSSIIKSFNECSYYTY